MPDTTKKKYNKAPGFAWCLTELMVEWLLSGCTLEVHPNTMTKWRKHEKLMKLATIVKIAKESHSAGLSSAADKVLWESLQSEDPAVRLRAALHIKELYPEEDAKELVVKPLGRANFDDIEPEKARRAWEEIEEDKQRKRGEIPVPKVGMTKKFQGKQKPTKPTGEVYEPDV